MNIRFLETFVWIARLRSFTAAAERLHTTQAAISQRMSTLEEVLGARLLSRDAREVTLTSEGQRILHDAEEIVRLYSGLRAVHEAVTPRELFCAYAEAPALIMMPSISRDLLTAMPGVKVTTRIELSARIEELLEDGIIDFAISYVEHVSDAIVRLPIIGLPLRWVASPSMRLPTEKLSIGDIAQLPLISCPPNTILARILDEQLRTWPSTASRLQLSNSTSMMARLAVEGVGVSLLPPAIIQRELREGALRILDVEGPIPKIECYLCFSTNADPALANLVTAACSRSMDYCLEKGTPGTIIDIRTQQPGYLADSR